MENPTPGIVAFDVPFAAPEKRLAWIASWSRPFESLWLLLRKLADKNGLTVPALSPLLGFPAHKLRYLQAMTVNDVDVEAIHKIAQFRKGALREGLCDYYADRWDDVAPTLVICPTCARQGFHTAMHQLTLFDKCPVHGDPLLRKCPTCDKAATPYGLGPFDLNCQHPYACRDCKTPLIRAFVPAAEVKCEATVWAETAAWLHRRARLPRIWVQFNNAAGIGVERLKLAAAAREAAGGAPPAAIARSEEQLASMKFVGQAAWLPAQDRADTYAMVQQAIRRHLWRHHLGEHKRCVQALVRNARDGALRTLRTASVCPAAAAYLLWRARTEHRPGPFTPLDTALLPGSDRGSNGELADHYDEGSLRNIFAGRFIDLMDSARPEGESGLFRHGLGLTLMMAFRRAQAEVDRSPEEFKILLDSPVTARDLPRTMEYSENGGVGTLTLLQEMPRLGAHSREQMSEGTRPHFRSVLAALDKPARLKKVASGMMIQPTLKKWQQNPVAAFKDLMAMHYAASTIVVWSSMWGKFCRYCQRSKGEEGGRPEGPISPVKAAHKDLFQFIGTLRPKRLRLNVDGQPLPVSDAIKLRYCVVFELAFGELRRLGFRQDDPVAGLMTALKVRYTSDDPRPVHLDVKEVKALSDTWRGMPRRKDDTDTARAIAVQHLILGAGLRVSEIRGLDIADLEFGDDGQLHVVIVATGARRTGRRVSVAPFAVSAVKTWLEHRARLDPRKSHTLGRFLAFPTNAGGEPMAACTIYRMVANAMRAANLDKGDVGPRVLRHTFAAELLRQSPDIRGASAAIGHKYENSTLHLYQGVLGI